MCIPYTTEFLQVTEEKNIVAESNSITFLNMGTSAATVNGLTLQQNQSISIQGNINEKDKTAYYITFAPTGAKQLFVIRKIYI